MAKRKASEASLFEVVHEILHSTQLQQGFYNVRIVEAWHALLGKGISNYTENVYLKGNILFVVLNSSVVREQLSYGKSKIIEMLNQEVKETVVTDIIFK